MIPPARFSMLDMNSIRKKLLVRPGHRVSLKRYDPGWTPGRIADVEGWLAKDVKRLASYQERLYAQDTYALLLIFQAMDAAGKDSTIRHVMSGVNPLGCQVFSFKAPSAEERDHDFLWRSVKALPERGRIGIHNRSHYEEVLAVRVHPEIVEGQQLPKPARKKGIWSRRFEAINNLERHLVENGTIILKFFLHVSKDEQKKRFLERIDQPEKNWKFSASDVRERRLWRAYMKAYEDVFTYTSTEWAPWFIVPADHKWFTRLAVAGIVNHTLGELNLEFPTLSAERMSELEKAKALLLAE
jgi:PPK2 family polyphosphate:nucleotide phosphotransferase